MIDEPVYLVDASIYVFRAWYTLPDDITDRDGRPANAVYGFTDFVARLLEEQRPAKLGFAFDESLTTSFRNEIYPEYKANRAEVPQELKRQFSHCRAFLAAVGLAEFGSDRYEADDLIGTLAAKMRKRGYVICILSGDKDLAQLIDHRDVWWDYAKNNKLDNEGVQNHFGVRPVQIPDLLAIAGDPVDNIPGVPGIGIKTAARLLNKFGTVEALLDNTAEIMQMKIRGASRIRELVEAHQDTIRVAKKLTRIHCEIELPVVDGLNRKLVNSARLTEVFDQLAFRPQRRERWAKLVLNA